MTRYFFSLLLILSTGSAFAQAADESDLQSQMDSMLHSWCSILSGKSAQFESSGVFEFEIDQSPQSVEFRLVRYSDDSFDLQLKHRDYALDLRRRADTTALALPNHEVVYLGKGSVHDKDHLAPENLLRRLISPDSGIEASVQFVQLMASIGPAAFAEWLTYDAEARVWRVGKSAVWSTPEPDTLLMTAVNQSVRVRTVLEAPAMVPADHWPEMKTIPLDRDELERTLTRGVRRATEVLNPGFRLVRPDQDNDSAPNGLLRWIDGQRLVLLWGTPEQIGRSHGRLLRQNTIRCIDSVMHSFGTAHVIRTGRWFRQDLDDAYARLSPHIPERHKRETQSLARAVGVDPHQMQILNVFPELFHCSGFAVFDSATKDGKLYHGRVLDYMTTIGLQDAATTFIIKANGQIPFVNVGYAGFIGSVSGMNAEAVSLGEMGGKGEGSWDGVPMATLMRRALEECHTLDEVKNLWRDHPRTCEYYYVFADGKTNNAVGVAATAETLEFIQPNQAHPQLGDGIPDAVVLSAGSRLETLRQRVLEKHGQIDADVGKWLMSRPVAMESNLHNVLFVPADRVLYVANAGHGKPAAEMPYVRIDFNEWLTRIPSR